MNELEIFKSLKKIKVVFDVGAKGTEYPTIKPKATYHLFEPNPAYFNQLPKGDNIYANNYGLGDKEESKEYDINAESFGGSEVLPHGANGPVYLIKTLDQYIKENNIKRLDFLKIDTEGFDYKVLQGGQKAVMMAKYIQYEHWDRKEIFHEMLEGIFNMEYIGLRNVFCTRK